MDASYEAVLGGSHLLANNSTVMSFNRPSALDMERVLANTLVNAGFPALGALSSADNYDDYDTDSSYSTLPPLNKMNLASYLVDVETYKCPVCSVIIKHSRHFKCHYRKHVTDKPHSCPHCDYRCWRPTDLRSHVFRKHSDLGNAQP